MLEGTKRANRVIRIQERSSGGGQVLGLEELRRNK